MIDLSVSNLIKSFTIGDNILDGVTFHVNQGERVGLLGKNGCGKSTLFKVLTGEYDYDEGEIAVAPSRRIGLISQIPVDPQGYTVEAVLDSAFQRVHQMEQEMGVLADQMAAGDTSREVLERYDKLNVAFELAGGYDTAVQVSKVCNGLGIPDAMRQQSFDSLSGGEQTRVNLGRLILEDTDILLLDEPTNHLDLHAVEWLEQYLSSFRGTVLVISHDRYFLDQVVNRIVELNQGRAEFYSGNYSFYAAEKEKRYQEQLRQYEKEQAKITQLTATATLMHEHGTAKMHQRAFAMEKRIERMRSTECPVTKERSLKVQFSTREFSGDELFTVEGLKKNYGGRKLFDHVDLEAIGGDRIALLGDNGTGKTTFLKILLGEELPDKGWIHFGPSVKKGYLPQIVQFENPERTLMDTMIWEQNCSAQEVRDRLGAFRFRGDDVFKLVDTLSGGERSRLKLCMLMDERINLLVLDEPTNHLDIASREWIESAVEAFNGALLFVSHDRYFINRFANRIWMLEDGGIVDFKGGYDAWLAKKDREVELKNVLKPQSKRKPEKEKGSEKKKQSGGTKMTEKKRNATEREIAKVEGELQELAVKMEECGTDYQKLQEIADQQAALESRLEELYQQWEDLSLLLEEVQ